MIRLAETADALRPLCGSAFGCPILSAAAAYGFSRPFAQFWTDGAAAYGMLDGVMRIAGTVADPEEGAGVPRRGRRGAGRVQRGKTARGSACASRRAARCSKRRFQAQPLRLRSRSRCARCTMCSPQTTWPANSSRFTSTSRTVCATALRARRCCMRAAKRSRRRWRRWPGENALVTAVAVLPAWQNKGYGGAVLRAVEEQLGGCRAYLLRAEHGKRTVLRPARLCAVRRVVRGRFGIKEMMIAGAARRFAGWDRKERAPLQRRGRRKTVCMSFLR